MSPWLWILLFLLALVGVWALIEAADLKDPVLETSCFLGCCGLVYIEETWDDWVDRWRAWWGVA